MLVTALRSAARTDPGRVRRNNEDAYHLDPDRGIFLVVDGIGGHNAGEHAAAIAVERIRARLERQTGAPELRIREAIAIANNEILAAARSNAEWVGMACVLTLAVIENGTAYIGHVGDSRLYSIQRGEIRKVTHDHSPVGEREDSGEIGEAEAMKHPRRNEVFRDVGSEEHTPDDANFIETAALPFDAETALVLCSDGLSDQVSSPEIQRIVENHASDPDAAARDLIAAANAAGGKDNVTVVVIQGERFTGPARPQRPVSRPRRWPFVVTGLIELAAAGALVYFYLHPKPPVIIEPQTLIAGTGGAYSTIGAALLAAHPGDTVDVLPGEYREHIFLKTGVVLHSHTPREARLIAAAGNNTAVTASSVQGARLEGFLIAADAQNPLQFGILLQDTNAVIVNTEIAGAATCISISGARAPELTADAIRDCSEAGVAIEAGVNPWLFHNSFQRNKVAIAIHGDANPQLVGNVFDKTPTPPAFAPPTLRDHNFLLDFRPAGRGSSGSGPGSASGNPFSNRKGKEK
jgi:serine/threonine protein phosphatase PrpC